MTTRFALLLGACLLASCTTVATKTRPAFKPPQTNQAKKQPKAMSGMTATKPQEQITSEPLAIPAPINAPKTEDAMEYLKALVNRSVQAPTKQEQDANRLHAIDIVENKLNEEQLDEVAKNSDFGYLRAHAMFRIGESELEQKNNSAAVKYFSSVIDFLPGSDLAARSQEIIHQLEASKNVQTQTVGVVLPLSGKKRPCRSARLARFGNGLGPAYSRINFQACGDGQ